VLNRPLPLSFYASDPGAKASAYNLVLQTLSHKSSSLYEHLIKTFVDADPDSYLADLFTSIFTGSLTIDESARLWDAYVFEGDAILVRAAVAVLMEREMALLGAKTVEELSEALKGCPPACKERAAREIGHEDRWMWSVRDAGKA
jgi:hypothetical protein